MQSDEITKLLDGGMKNMQSNFDKRKSGIDQVAVMRGSNYVHTGSNSEDEMSLSQVEVKSLKK